MIDSCQWFKPTSNLLPLFVLISSTPPKVPGRSFLIQSFSSWLFRILSWLSSVTTPMAHFFFIPFPALMMACWNLLLLVLMSEKCLQATNKNHDWGWSGCRALVLVRLILGNPTVWTQRTLSFYVHYCKQPSYKMLHVSLRFPVVHSFIHS